jgi:hypothetical protein
VNKTQQKLVFIFGIILLVGLCLTGFIALGSGVTLWFAFENSSNLPTPTRRIIRQAEALVTPSPTIEASATATATQPPPATSTFTPVPTATPAPTQTPVPPTDTPVPPTDTPEPTQAPPTATPLPTDTPIPAFPFAILETGQFPTNHLDFDVFIAVTDAGNKPLNGYRVIGQHSGGMQAESEVSAPDWTHNSGAMHYKAGNIKYSVPKSPGGTWVLQLIDGAGNPVAPAVEFPFDPANPTWYFLLYRKTD